MSRSSSQLLLFHQSAPIMFPCVLSKLLLSWLVAQFSEACLLMLGIRLLLTSVLCFFQIHVSAAVHGDPFNSWGSPYAGSHLFCYSRSWKEVRASKWHSALVLLSLPCYIVINSLVLFSFVSAGTPLRCHWISRLHSVRVKAARPLYCCTLKRLIWWKSWLLKGLKGSRFDL